MLKLTTVNDKYQDNDLCLECAGKVISINAKGESVCCKCGLILKEKEIITSYGEKRAYNKDERTNRSRTGNPVSPFLRDIGLSTLINKKGIFNPDLKRAVKRDTSISWEHRNMLIAITELKRICSNLKIPDYVKELALNLYRKVFEKNLLKERTIEGMVAVCVYYACRNKTIPRTIEEILAQITISNKVFNNCYKTKNKNFSLKIPNHDLVSMIPQFVSNLGLNIDVEKLAIKILNNYLKDACIKGKNPKGLCAGAIYLATKLRNAKITQKEISTVIQITDVTLRSRYKEIMNGIDIFKLQ